MTKRAIDADFADYRRVKTRKVLQLIIEVALEREKEIFETLGFPDTATGTPVAIARLAVTTAPDSPPPGGPAEAAGEGQDTRRTPKFSERSPSQQAAIMCRNIAFQDWLIESQDHGLEPGHYPDEEEYAKAILAVALGITSKTELDKMPSKAELWSQMLTSFRNKDVAR